MEELLLCSVSWLETALTSQESRWLVKGTGLGFSHNFETQLCNGEEQERERFTEHLLRSCIPPWEIANRGAWHAIASGFTKSDTPE